MMQCILGENIISEQEMISAENSLLQRKEVSCANSRTGTYRIEARRSVRLSSSVPRKSYPRVC